MTTHTSIIERAAEFAGKAHAGQTRKFTGIPYYTHVEGVAQLVSQRTKDEELVAAAYLHDTIEDCGVTPAELEALFGPRVAAIVQSLTNDEEAIEQLGKVSYMVGKLRRLSADALLIKLCDMLHNTTETQSQRQAANYLAIITQVAGEPPACWSPLHAELYSRICSAAARKWPQENEFCE